MHQDVHSGILLNNFLRSTFSVFTFSRSSANVNVNILILILMAMFCNTYREDYQNLVFSCLADHRKRFFLIRPSIVKPVKLWSGKQV